MFKFGLVSEVGAVARDAVALLSMMPNASRVLAPSDERLVWTTSAARAGSSCTRDGKAIWMKSNAMSYSFLPYVILNPVYCSRIVGLLTKPVLCISRLLILKDLHISNVSRAISMAKSGRSSA